MLTMSKALLSTHDTISQMLLTHGHQLSVLLLLICYYLVTKSCLTLLQGEGKMDIIPSPLHPGCQLSFLCAWVWLAIALI